MKNRIAKIDGLPDVLTSESVLNRNVDLVKRPRQGWEDAFRDIAARGDDELLDGNLLDHAYDEDEW
jgi:hypothetical protein